MGILQSPLLDRETYSPRANLHAVGLSLALSCAKAGFLEWASNSQAQLRDAGAKSRRAPARPAPRRTPKHTRRLFIWGFIGANAAVSIAWAHAADEAAAAGAGSPWGIFSALLLPRRVPAGLLACMADNVALSAAGVLRGRWWTLLTSSVCHVSPAHLVANMAAFYVWASRLFDLGLGPAAVAGLMLGSAACCGVVGFAGEDPRRPGIYMGASGVVCGLRIAAVLLEPVIGFRVPGVCDLRWPLFASALMGSVADISGLLSQRPSPTGGGSRGAPHKSFISHAGHLGGMAFGVAYWYFSLRSRFGTW